MKRFILASLLVLSAWLAIADDADAGLFRRRHRRGSSSCSNGSSSCASGSCAR